MEYHETGARRNMSHVTRVLWITLGLNLAVAAVKLVVGLLDGSLALTSDGIHSVSDASSNIVALISLRWAARPADDDHHYGHHKIEILAAAGISFFLLLTAWEILRAAVGRLIEPSEPAAGVAAFVTVGATFAVNLFVAVYERRAARRLGSRLLEADAAHTASDLLVTVTVLASLVAVRLGVAVLDPVFAGLIALYVAWMGLRILRRNALTLIDSAPLDPEEVRTAVAEVVGVQSCHRIRTRGWEGHIFVDLHVQIDPDLDTVAGHDIVHAVQRVLRHRFPGVRDVLIHTEPSDSA